MSEQPLHYVLGGPMERIVVLKDSQQVRVGWLWFLSAIVLVLSLSVIHLVNQISVTQRLELTVMDRETQEPLGNTDLLLFINDSQMELTTNTRGECAVLLPDESTDQLVFDVSVDGYVPTRVSWGGSRDEDPVPPRFTLELERGTSIGGVVRDEDGNPLAGTQLRTSAVTNQQSLRTRPFVVNQVTTTDTAGKWRYDNLPGEIQDVSIRLNHPDYRNDGHVLLKGAEKIDELRAMTPVIVMTQGIVIQGHVLDSQGEPIAKAAVAQDPFRTNTGRTSTATDASGYFRFENCQPGQTVLTVETPRHAPEQKLIDVDEEGAEIDFQLTPGHTIRGRVVNTAGVPVRHAGITANRWRGFDALTWKAETDDDGRFVWNAAPPDEVSFQVSARRYMYISDLVMSPREEDYVITLSPLMPVTGKVADALTGAPITTFKARIGVRTSEGSIYWIRGRRRTFTMVEGEYRCRIQQVLRGQRGYVIRIEAEGYISQISNVFHGDEGELRLDFRLERTG